MTEEPFGPLAPIVTFKTMDEVVERANSLPYGLAAYAFTSSAQTATMIGDAMQSRHGRGELDRGLDAGDAVRRRQGIRLRQRRRRRRPASLSEHQVHLAGLSEPETGRRAERGQRGRSVLRGPGRCGVRVYLPRTTARVVDPPQAESVVPLPTGSAEPPVLRPGSTNSTRCSGPSVRTLRIRARCARKRTLSRRPDCLPLPVSLAVVLQYVEGNSWSLASAALAASSGARIGAGRSTRGDAAPELRAVDDVFRARLLFEAPRMFRSARRSSAQGLVDRKPLDAEYFSRLSRAMRGARRVATLRAALRDHGGRFAERRHPAISTAVVTHPFAET